MQAFSEVLPVRSPVRNRAVRAESVQGLSSSVKSALLRQKRFGGRTAKDRRSRAGVCSSSTIMAALSGRIRGLVKEPANPTNPAHEKMHKGTTRRPAFARGYCGFDQSHPSRAIRSASFLKMLRRISSSLRRGHSQAEDGGRRLLKMASVDRRPFGLLFRFMIGNRVKSVSFANGLFPFGPVC